MNLLNQKVLLAVLITGVVFVVLNLKRPRNKKNDDVLIAGIMGSCPPYLEVSKNGELKGFCVDVFKELSRKLNKPFDVKLITSGAADTWLNDDQVDLIGPALAIKPDRLKQMDMVHVYGEPHPDFIALFRAEEHFPAELTFEKLKQMSLDKMIGTLVGSNFGGLLKEKGIDNIHAFKDVDELLTALKSGKIDAVVIGPRASEYFVRRDSTLKTVKVTLDKPWGAGAGIGIKKGRPALVAQVQAAMTALKDEGVINKLKLQWFGDCDKKY